jgi:hypothetical protein
MADLVEAVFLAGKLVIKAHAEEAEARRLYTVNQTKELLDRWNHCHEETNRLIEEHGRLVRQVAVM